MAIVRANFISGQVQENPLSSVATSMAMSGKLLNLPTVGGGDGAWLTLDPEGVDTLAGSGIEVVKVSAYTHGAGSCTIARGQRGTTPRPHSQGTKVVLASYKEDWDAKLDVGATAANSSALNGHPDTYFATAAALTAEANSRAAEDTTLQSEIDGQAGVRLSEDQKRPELIGYGATMVGTPIGGTFSIGVQFQTDNFVVTPSSGGQCEWVFPHAFTHGLLAVGFESGDDNAFNGTFALDSFAGAWAADHVWFHVRDNGVAHTGAVRVVAHAIGW